MKHAKFLKGVSHLGEPARLTGPAQFHMNSPLMNYKCSRFSNYAADNMDTKGCKMATFLPKDLLLCYNSSVELLSKNLGSSV